MAEDDPFEPVYTFFFAWFGFTLAVFPLVATVDSSVFDGSLSGPVVLAISIVTTFPAGIEFVFSDREPRRVGKFVGVFVALYFVAILAQASVYVAIGVDETIPVLEFAVLFATYVAAYVLVYRGGLARVRAALTR
ncbi:MAG: hypothetical protein U5J98_05635 [Halobacteriales archaeon]|nr:hypothetical protein [Halobacteriales archaeon]